MKKKIFLFGLCFALCSSAPVLASVDDANKYLSEKEKDGYTFSAEEYLGSDKNKGTLLVTVTTPLEKATDCVLYTSDILADMARQEWFSYSYIQCLTFYKEYGKLATDVTFSVDSGTYSQNTGIHSFPWLIKTEKELSSNEISLITRIIQELMAYNVDSLVTVDKENISSIKECNGLVEARGSFLYDEKKYNFITQFTYSSSDSQNTTYDTKYVSINDLDTYGEYKEFNHITIN